MSWALPLCAKVHLPSIIAHCLPPPNARRHVFEQVQQGFLAWRDGWSQYKKGTWQLLHPGEQMGRWRQFAMRIPRFRGRGLRVKFFNTERMHTGGTPTQGAGSRWWSFSTSTTTTTTITIEVWTKVNISSFPCPSLYDRMGWDLKDLAPSYATRPPPHPQHLESHTARRERSTSGASCSQNACALFEYRGSLGHR